jgi:GTP pyrophosphokinase
MALTFDTHTFGLPPTQPAAHGAAVAAALAQLGHEPVLDAAARLLFVDNTADAGDAGNIARQAAQVLRMATQLRPLLAASSLAGKNVRDAKAQVELLRRLMLAMATDLRVVLIALGSRLVSLRACLSAGTAPDAGLVLEVLQVFAPLANRLGVWQLKWELEDLAFRYAQPERYQKIADALDAKREQRQALIETVCQRLSGELAITHVTAQVYGRPKHIYSIANKMAAKGLPFEGLYDLRAVRVVVASLRDCYTALGVVHDVYKPIAKEFDDYIARPKPNGYQSLHTVIVADDGKPVEVQIRTEQMHAFAEFGVAAHWRYKEGRHTASTEEAKIAWLRQLLAWKKDLSDLGEGDAAWASGGDTFERMFCLTPAGRVVELVGGGTPIDFAYALHTDLGHRCRGAKVDGAMVPLNTPLRSGQTVEILADRKIDAGPSRDWLSPTLGYTASPRSRTKVRAWFNALAKEAAIEQGRELVERELARLGKSAAGTIGGKTGGFAQLAVRMGFADADALFVAANKTDFHTRTIEAAFETPKDDSDKDADELARTRIAAAAAKSAQEQQARSKPKGDVLVVGVDMLLTQLARCCRPAPPDAVMGYVTRGKGVSLHRAGCASLRHLANKSPERLIDCAWGKTNGAKGTSASTGAGSGANAGAASHYPVEVRIIAADRQGLLRDISDAFSKHKINITAVQTQTARGEARMLLSAQVDSVAHLNTALGSAREVKGVVHAARR